MQLHPPMLPDRRPRGALLPELAHPGKSAVRRWEKFTREQAIHADSGLPFAELQEVRHHER